MRKEFENGQLLFTPTGTRLPLLAVRGAIGIGPLVEAVRSIEHVDWLDRNKKDSIVSLINWSVQEVTDFFQMGGVTSKDGKIFIKGLIPLESLMEDYVNFRVALSRAVVMTSKGKSVRDYFGLDVKHFGSVKRIHIVNEGAHKSLSCKFTIGGSADFYANGISIGEVESGLAAVINRMQPPLSERVVASSAIVRQTLYGMVL